MPCFSQAPLSPAVARDADGATDCCPPSSLGHQLEEVEYMPAGAMHDFGGVPAYVVGADCPIAVLVIHDVFGLKSGRLRKICDDLSSELGVQVVAPVLFESEACGGYDTSVAVERAIDRSDSRGLWDSTRRMAGAAYHGPSWFRDLKRHGWDVVGPKLEDTLLPAMRARGVRRIGFLGMCWGGWVVFRASAHNENDICCGATMHPSQIQLCGIHGEDFGKLCGDIGCPQLVLSAQDDKPGTKPGGQAEEALKGRFGDACVFQEFPDMRHGWFNRGNLADPKVSRDFAKSWKLLTVFFREHLLK